ncbi:MAG: GTP cyclohydrolase II RibA [Rhodospirillales bacterium]
MPKPLDDNLPLSRRPVTLITVDRAVAELRRGRAVAIQGAAGRAILALAAEAVTDDTLADLADRAGSTVRLALTRRRGAVLGLALPAGAPQPKEGQAGETGALLVTGPAPWPAEAVLGLADPLLGAEAAKRSGLVAQPVQPYYPESAAVRLAKLARLLPAALVADIALAEREDLSRWCARHDLVLLDAGDIFQYDTAAARTLKPVSEAKVPLLDAENSRIIAFRPFDGGLEHLAIVIGEPHPGDAVLARLHSECFTGDLLGSLRCDCGDQLRGAIAEMHRAGGGVLLYLAQEGRGIGLVNKLRAYQLQDDGLDTMDANLQLGFDADERIYLPAAEMLRGLGFPRVRLLTNNPDKVAALEACGITVTERVAHTFPSNRHNEAYLKTKASKGGHLF